MPDADTKGAINTFGVGDEQIAGQVPVYADSGSSPQAPFRFRLRTLLLLITLAVCCAAVVASIWRTAERRREIMTAFKSVGTLYEMHLDQQVLYSRVPPSLQPTSQVNSWRFQLFRTGQMPTGWKADFQAPWNAPVNQHFAARPSDAFCLAEGGRSTDTNIFGILGPGTAIELSFNPRGYKDPPAVVLAMEVANSKIHWMQPGDYDVTKLLAATGRLGDTVKGLLPDRVHLLFADGEVWALAPDMPIDAMKPFLTITAAKNASREDSLSEFRVDK